MSQLIKAYSDELNSVYNQIDTLAQVSANHPDEDYYLSNEFLKQIKNLYERKAVLKALINDLNKR